MAWLGIEAGHVVNNCPPEWEPRPRYVYTNCHGPGLGLEPMNVIPTEDTPVVELRLSIMLSLTIGDVLSAFSLLIYELVLLNVLLDTRTFCRALYTPLITNPCIAHLVSVTFNELP